MVVNVVKLGIRHNMSRQLLSSPPGETKATLGNFTRPRDPSRLTSPRQRLGTITLAPTGVAPTTRSRLEHLGSCLCARLRASNFCGVQATSLSTR